jgi:AhpD family alkylhydroperoxidase
MPTPQILMQVMVQYTPLGTIRCCAGPPSGETDPFSYGDSVTTFNHSGLMQDINDALGPFRKSQSDAMQGFGQLARASMAEGALSAKHKELLALAIGITQHCSGCIAFHVKALHKLQCTRKELEEMLTVCVYMGGGPALMYVAEVLKAWDALQPAA